MNTTDNDPIKLKIMDILLEMSIDPGLYGYAYLTDAILLCYKNEKAIKSMTKKVYPTVAKKHKTSVKSVERNIRYAIERAFEKVDKKSFKSLQRCFYSLINPKSGKVTNTVFIGKLTAVLRVEIQEDIIREAKNRKSDPIKDASIREEEHYAKP